MKVFLPESMDALWDILEREPDTCVYAGGTDLLIKLRTGVISKHAIICLERIDELRGVSDLDREVFIGACTTHTALLEDPLITRSFPILQRAVRSLGSPPIRHMGTIGGNICTASPAGDTLPPLYLLEAEIETRSRNASRRMPIEQFITGPGRTVLNTNEIVYGIRVRKPYWYTVQHFEKVGQRKAMSISIASLAALLNTDTSGVVRKARLAWGSVGPTIVMSRAMGQMLEGQRLSLESLRQVMDSVAKTVSPIDDVRASAAYRRTISANLLLRLLLYTSHDTLPGS